MRKKRKNATAAPDSHGKSSTLMVQEDREPSDAVLARMAVAGLVTNASTTADFSRSFFGELGLTECLAALVDAVEAVKRGDRGNVEALLTAQAVALNAIFTRLANRSALNMGEHLDAAERYMRLALKAQGQCRTTLETLAVIKSPVVFARQANIAHGPQQVNNAASPASRVSCARAHSGNPKNGQNELLEAHGERLDASTACAAKAGNPGVAPVGTRKRPTDH